MTLESSGDQISTKNSAWTFNSANVAQNFDSHVSKSVPMYNEGHDLIVKMSDFFVSNNSLIVDLGCSTGTLISKLYERNKHKSINILGIDSSKQMIDQALIDNANPSVSYVVDDFINVEFGNADLITSYYTIQDHK